MNLQTVKFGTSGTNYLNKVTNLELRVKRDPVTFDLTDYSASAAIHLNPGEVVPSAIKPGALLHISGYSPSTSNVTYTLRLSAPTITVAQDKHVTVNVEAEGMADLYQSASRIILQDTNSASKRWDAVSSALPRPLSDGDSLIRIQPYKPVDLDTAISVFYPTWREEATYLEMLTVFARTIRASIMPFTDCTGPIGLAQINPDTPGSLYTTNSSRIELGSTWSKVDTHLVDGAIVNLTSEAVRNGRKWEDSGSYNATTATYGGAHKIEVRTMLSEGYDDIDNRIFPYRAEVLRLIGESLYRRASDWSPDIIKVRTDSGGDDFASLEKWEYPITIRGVQMPAGLRKFDMRGFVVSMTLKSRFIKDGGAVLDADLELAHVKLENAPAKWENTEQRWLDRDVPWTW